MDIRNVLAAVLVTVFVAPAANAYYVKADPANFAKGTDVTNAFDSMTMETWRTQGGNPFDGYAPIVKSSIFSDIATGGEQVINGQAVFASGDVLGWGDTNVFFRADYVAKQLQSNTNVYAGNALVTTFDQGSNYVEVVGGARGTGDYFLAAFFDTDGNFMGQCQSVDPSQINNPVYNPLGCKLSNSGTAFNPDNAYTKDLWTITWHDENRKVGKVVTGGYGGNQYVRSIYAAVPEPGAISLLGLSLMFMGVVQGRRNVARKS
jgi:hypothetical protein